MAAAEAATAAPAPAGGGGGDRRMAAAEAAVASLKTRTRVLHLMGSDSVAHFHFLWRTKIHSLLRFRKLLDTNFCIPMTAAAAAADYGVDDGGYTTAAAIDGGQKAVWTSTRITGTKERRAEAATSAWSGQW
mmetsp:Transcript_13523/g.27638  ORF Transcript_13523/g.27638 Transcript_13523/m.27638 type:complete len:132 (-) Transcript_13523:1506-1901(-)